MQCYPVPFPTCPPTSLSDSQPSPLEPSLLLTHINECTHEYKLWSLASVAYRHLFPGMTFGWERLGSYQNLFLSSLCGPRCSATLGPPLLVPRFCDYGSCYNSPSFLDFLSITLFNRLFKSWILLNVCIRKYSF